MKPIYFKRIKIENVGPLGNVDYTFPINSGLPRPVVFVGANGSGKSILLSHLLNPLLAAHQIAFDDSEVEQNFVYKLRSPLYVKSGADFSYSKICFGDQFECEEWQLLLSRTEHEKRFGIPPVPSFLNIPEGGTSSIQSNFESKPEAVAEAFRSNCILYFPASRFEQPAWLNERNLKSVAEFQVKPNINRISNRRIIQDAPLNATKHWLLDLLLDRATYGMRLAPTIIPTTDSYVCAQLFCGFEGDAENLWNAITKCVQLVLGFEEGTRLGVGPRNNRNVAVMNGDTQQIVANIFQLSTGQTSVLNFLLSILRDFDSTGSKFTTINEVSGVVIIDEIDAHLHSDFQCTVLPEFLKLFPKVQFIVTTHSPLFLLGMKNHFGADGFDTISLPSAKRIDLEEFEEFQAVYEVYSGSRLFRQKIEAKLQAAQLPAVFVEGEFDIRYLRRAAELLSCESILERVELLDASGWGNLDKVWRSCEGPIGNAVPRDILLIYDCDVAKCDQDNGRAKKRVVPTIQGNPIQKGIENLIPASTIQMLRTTVPQFFDVTPAITKTIRGKETSIPEVCEVNRSEKANLCNWLCTNGTAADFAGFRVVLDLIDKTFPLSDSVAKATAQANEVTIITPAFQGVEHNRSIAFGLGDEELDGQFLSTSANTMDGETAQLHATDNANLETQLDDQHVTNPCTEASDRPF